MKNKNTAVVIHACGFSSKDSICPVFQSRVEKAVQIIKELDKKKTNHITVIITGGVPYEIGSLMLARCGGDYFKSLFNPAESIPPIFYAETCFNSSTDTLEVLLMLSCNCIRQDMKKNIIVISSYWHNWILKQTYKYWKRILEYNPPIIFTSPSKDIAGIKTIAIYATLSAIMKLLNIISFAATDKFDRFLNKKQVKRKDGFPVLGCD